jgi:hypothetical protein
MKRRMTFVLIVMTLSVLAALFPAPPDDAGPIAASQGLRESHVHSAVLGLL